ncbi:MAG: LytTR family DNA-binding domain-containing protein [Bacteroidota bacterium]
MKILIIEDEKWTAKDLRNTLLSIEPSAEIIGIFDSVAGTVTFLQTQPAIDLIFSDIQLTDGQSFEIFEQININCPIVFCTAYNEYALKAFDTMGIDYILKPFKRADIADALKKYHAFERQFKQIDLTALSQLLQPPATSPSAPPTSIIIHQGEKIVPIPIKEIAFFFVEDSYVFSYTFGKKKHLVNQTMSELEDKFTPNFFRANRQFLVHRTAIDHASQYFHRKLLVHLKVDFSEKILVNKQKSTAFLQWLATN